MQSMDAKLIITDIADFNIPVTGKYHIINPHGTIKHCIGCWVKTPGECVVHEVKVY